MRLHVMAREHYVQEIGTDPAITAWEASFDDGLTWVEGESADEAFRWLVEGPDAPAGATTGTVLTSSVLPLLRAVDNPEVIIRQSTRIHLIGSVPSTVEPGGFIDGGGP